jgi:hypothetical protein
MARKRKAKTSVRGRRKLAKILSKHRQAKPVSTPLMKARQQILSQMSDLIAAHEELFEQHGEACECDACCLVSNMLSTIRIFKMLLESSTAKPASATLAAWCRTCSAQSGSSRCCWKSRDLLLAACGLSPPARFAA